MAYAAVLGLPLGALVGYGAGKAWKSEGTEWNVVFETEVAIGRRLPLHHQGQEGLQVLAFVSSIGGAPNRAALELTPGAKRNNLEVQGLRGHDKD